MAASRLAYYRRIFSAYVLRRRSQLTFWHETPELTPEAFNDHLGRYYMTFAGKAAYPGPFDSDGIPLIDYRGSIGRRYNPIAVAQYGLALHNRFADSGDPADRNGFLAQARWLMHNLEPNPQGVPVWNHHFDWEYRETLQAPWYSGLAQGQGISLLLRAHRETGDAAFLDAATEAFRALDLELDDGGVRHTDAGGGTWLEEYVVDPPSHILNGFIWALWGVRDYALATDHVHARTLFERCASTLASNLARFDCGFWSLYELGREGSMKMLASSFYHRLHIVQLQVMHRLTGKAAFLEYADRWERYASNPAFRATSLVHKAAFKLLHY